MEKKIEKFMKVIVTGATGFIGAHVVAQLLGGDEWQHCVVVGTVRDPRGAAARFLRALPGADGGRRLVLEAMDLRDGASVARVFAAHADARAVLHVASPYRLDARDAEAELVRPAVDGTLAVLRAAWAAPAVARVVLTSSIAAVLEGGTRSSLLLPDAPECAHVYTEADWNDRSTATRMPYYYSKAAAERAAWRFVADHPAQDGRRLVVLNPYMVVGPALDPASRDVNQSVAPLLDLARGALPALLNVRWGLVDVRDVARAHLLLMADPDAQGRYLCSHPVVPMRDVATLLRARFPRLNRVPKWDLSHRACSPLVAAAAWLQPRGTRQWIHANLDRAPRICSRRLLAIPGMSLRPVEESIVDTIDDLVRRGFLCCSSAL